MQLTDPIFYKDGIPGQSKVVGVESGVTRVARYTFQAPENGATGLTFALDAISKGNGADIPLRFAISTDPDLYCNAGPNSPYTGAVTIALWDYAAYGEAQVRLLPGQTYYLWLFPAKDQWGWYYVSAGGTVETTGVATGVAIVSDGILGQELPITIYDGAYTHRLTWQFGEFGGQLEPPYRWTPPIELAEAIPNAPSGICTFTCYSYLDGSQVGQPQISRCTLAVPEALAPQLSVAVTDTADALGLYLENISQLELAVTTTLHYGASLAATAITLDGEAYTGTVLPAGAHTLAVAVTDSRGLQGHWQQDILVAPYTPPRVELTASRCRVDGTLDDTGDHALVTVRGSVSNIAGNFAILRLTYGQTQVENPLALGQFETSTVIPADPNDTLYIKVRVMDAVKGTTRTMTLSTGYPTMEFYRGGKGIAFGKVAEAEGFHCAMDAYFSGKVCDGQGRPWAMRYDLTAVTGMYLSPVYGRVLDVLGAGFLQLKFTCNRNRSAGDQLYTAQLPLTEDLTVTDVTGKYSLLLTPTGVVANSSLPTGTYTFSTLLY